MLPACGMAPFSWYLCNLSSDLSKLNLEDTERGAYSCDHAPDNSWIRRAGTPSAAKKSSASKNLFCHEPQ